MELVEVRWQDRDLVDEIIHIEVEAFGENGGVDEWILKPMVRYGKVFVLKDSGRVVSIAEFIQKFNSEEVFLYGLCTRRGSRGRGYASEILRRSEEFFRKRNIGEIGLTVAPDNEAAINLYKNLDYEVIELQRDEYGKGVDRLFMKKKLNNKKK